jgi:hypothetical protein
MPIEPVDSSKKVSGEGKEKYDPDLKRGPGKFDEVLEKAKSDRAKAEIHDIAEKQRAKAEAERPRTYTERLQDMGRLPKSGGVGGGSGGGGSAGEIKALTNPRAMKKGGKVSSASKRADGCAIRGRTKI